MSHFLTSLTWAILIYSVFQAAQYLYQTFICQCKIYYNSLFVFRHFDIFHIHNMNPLTMEVLKVFVVCQVLKNEPYDNIPLLNGKFTKGQYTHKIYHLASKVGSLNQKLSRKETLLSTLIRETCISHSQTRQIADAFLCY